LAGCGYVGDPLPPLANIPSRVTDLAAVQRGGRIIVQFTIPERTTEGIAIKTPPGLDLRIGTATAPYDPGRWAAEARQIPESPLPYSIPSAEWTGKEVSIAVNVIGSNGKSSGWSNFANLTVVPAPPQPQALTAEATPEGVRLTWQGPSGEFRVFRRAGEEPAFAPVAEVNESAWTDAAAELGKPYTYLVQRIVKLGEHRAAESEPSSEISITPRDTFAPAAPAGLSAFAAPGSIELTWQQNPEADLAGYRIYRSVADAALEKIGDASQIPSYSDRAVEHGKTYRYAVSAVDQAGNESVKSAAVEVAFP
jgi:fibronectin type 3 domain-containing protein